MAPTHQKKVRGVSYQCYVCGYDIRQKADGSKGEPQGDYTPKIGFKHTTPKECMKIINYYLDHRLYLDRPHHREDVEA